MGKYFGTDGVRAVAGRFPLVKDFIIKLGYCALKAVEKRGDSPSCKSGNLVIMAEDSRMSGKEISEYLSMGIRAAGYNVAHIGIAPTPAVSYLTKKYKAVAGAVISASHNPAEFNGIKFFSRLGCKLGEDIEAYIEELMEALKSVPAPAQSARLVYDDAMLKDYKEFLKSTLPAGTSFKGIKIVLDCANGAAYKVAPEIFRELGADITVINASPNGRNINDNAGALYADAMLKKTKETGSFMGFSFDGDADRLIVSDETGSKMDGDDIIATLAGALKETGGLKGNRVVLTVMANLGLVNFLKSKGIAPELTQVGDKYVFKALEEKNLSLGGETSGHIIFRDIATSGDGILCALQLLAIILKSGKKPSHFRTLWRRYPLKLIAVKTDRKTALDKVPGFLPKIKELESAMLGKGRIFVRYSGTEPVLRILVEGEDKAKVEETALQVKDFYEKGARAPITEAII
jgi:phosphoglucosamine mutase